MDSQLKDKATVFRTMSISESTRKSRNYQWNRYLASCELLGWTPLPCRVEQACKYVTLLAEDLSFSSIQTYYQSVIFHHVCAGLQPVRLSNQILQATMNGIKRTKTECQSGKDPIFPEHLKKISKVVNRGEHIELIVFVAALFMFRTLLRVSHIVTSPHTLLRSDVKFNKEGCLVRIRSSKTTRSIGKVTFIPVTWAADSSICAVRGLRFILGLYPGNQDSPLFSRPGGVPISYSTFSKKFKILLTKANLSGDFASHSLRRGGATHMSMVGCSVPQIKDRGGWASDCVYRYIKPSLGHKFKVDKNFAKFVS